MNFSVKLLTFATVLLALVLSLGSMEAGELDTLRPYNSISPRVYFNDPAIDMQVMRIDLPAPATLNELILCFGGAIDRGQATVRVFGHEGGAPYPILQQNLVEPIRIHKSQQGEEWIHIRFSKPPAITNNQFFVAVTDCSAGMFLLSDSEEHRPACEDRHGRRFHAQYLRSVDNEWHYYGHAFLIDALVSFDAPEDQGYLRDVTLAAGIHDSLAGTYVLMQDLNRDRWPDLLTGGRLYRNVGGHFEDMSESVGLDEQSPLYCFIDINNDGLSDILGLGASADPVDSASLYLNKGGFAFHRQTIALPRVGIATSFSIADVNGDFLPDLFIGQYGREDGNIRTHLLLLNDAQNGFIDCSDSLGLPNALTGPGPAGAIFVDHDMDGDPDLFTAAGGGDDYRLWANEGTVGDRWRMQRRDIANIDRAAGISIGGDWGDFDNDGDLDLLLGRKRDAALGGNGASLNSVQLHVSDLGGDSEHSPADRGSRIAPELFHSAGVWGDVNNDGLLDFFLATRNACSYSELYEQLTPGSFSSATAEYGLWRLADSRDAILLDFNLDGRLDLATRHKGLFRLYVNEGPTNNNFSQIVLEGKACNKRAIGATVELHCGDKSFLRSLSSGRGLLVQGPSVLHFGLGDADEIDSVSVLWPNQNVEVFHSVPVNSLISLTEGSSPRGVERAATTLRLHAFPNPLKEESRLEFWLPDASDVSIGVYTLRNKLVTRLLDDYREAGWHSLRWRAVHDYTGAKLAPGIYLLVLRSAAGEAAVRVMVGE